MEVIETEKFEAHSTKWQSEVRMEASQEKRRTHFCGDYIPFNGV